MPRARPIHAGQRAIAELTLGVAKSTERRRQRESELGLAETEQQFQFPVSGSAGTLPAFNFLALLFDFPFHYAPGQRDSDLERPQMTFGGEVDAAVMLNAMVQAWYTDPDSGATTGAIVWVSALAGVDGTDFTGKMHVTFQGFSAPDDQPTDTTFGE